MKNFKLWFRYNRSIPEMYFCISTFVLGVYGIFSDISLEILSYIWLVSLFSFCGWLDKLELKRLRMRYYSLYSFSSNLYDKAKRIEEEKKQLKEELEHKH